jgi:hypothetical protein
MRYLLLLYGDEAGEAALSDDERRAIVEAHMAFGERLAERGSLVAGEGLTGRERARVVRRRDVRAPVVTDGPFAETKEQLGGFYVVECGSDDEALQLAHALPQSPGLVVEIRPVAG